MRWHEFHYESFGKLMLSNSSNPMALFLLMGKEASFRPILMDASETNGPLSEEDDPHPLEESLGPSAKRMTPDDPLKTPRGDRARRMTPLEQINASPPDEPPGPPLTKGKNQRIMTPKKPSAEGPPRPHQTPKGGSEDSWTRRVQLITKPQ